LRLTRSPCLTIPATCPGFQPDWHPQV